MQPATALQRDLTGLDLRATPRAVSALHQHSATLAASCKAQNARLRAVRALGGRTGSFGERDASKPKLDLTLEALDSVLGFQEAGQPASSVVAPAPGASPAPVAPAAPPAFAQEWADLPPQDLARRDRVLRRLCALYDRQQALAEQHWKYHSHAQELRQQMVQLAEQQRALQDELDPEAAEELHRRLTAAQQAAALRQRGVLTLSVLAASVALMFLGASIAGAVQPLL